MSQENKLTTWDKLSVIDCKELLEKKNKLTYLSWAWAWGLTKTTYPDANYTVKEYDGKPYLFDPILGYMVGTTVTIEGETIPMHLYVMDGANKAMRHEKWSYEVAEWKNGRKTGKMIPKNVEPATMAEISNTIMRCLTKNLAMFGLGHYVYAGEDLPKDVNEIINPVPPPHPDEPVEKEKYGTGEILLTKEVVDKTIKDNANKPTADKELLFETFKVGYYGKQIYFIELFKGLKIPAKKKKATPAKK